MKKINHTYFGELDLEKGLNDGMGFSDDTIVLWEEDIKEVNTTLWYDKKSTITTEILDIFVKFLKNFNEYDQKARKALEKYLEEDNEYITFHIDEVELDLSRNAKQFVECMKVTNVGLWADKDSVIIVDYMIAPQDTDEILAIKFDYSLDIVDIVWES